MTTDSTVLATVTPAPTATWLRSPIRPFLDRAITVTDVSDVTAAARAGVFEVLGRRLPVALTELRGSKRFELQITTTTAAERDAVRLFLSFGDVVLIQPPSSTCATPGPLYASVGDVAEVRRGKHDTDRRYFTLPLTECAPPDVSIVASTITWGGTISAFVNWAAVTAAKATWADLLATISNPTDEVVG